MQVQPGWTKPRKLWSGAIERIAVISSVSNQVTGCALEKAVVDRLFDERLGVGEIHDTSEAMSSAANKVGPVADVVVRDACDIADPQGKKRLRAVEGLHPLFSSTHGTIWTV